MANIITFNMVVDVLKDIATRHHQLQTFFLGRDWEIGNSQDVVYPMLQMYPTLSRMPINSYGEYKTIEFELNCKVVDLVNQSEINERDVHSDTLRIAQDIVNELNQHPYYVNSNASIVGDIQFDALEEFEDDFAAGWAFTIRLRLININSYCGLPFAELDGYSANGPVSTGYSQSVSYLTCSNVLDCTTLTDYITDEIDSALTGITGDNYYTTGATLNGNVVTFNRNDLMSAYTVDLTTLSPDLSGYVPTSGGTMTGQLNVPTVSATTYNNLPISQGYFTDGTNVTINTDATKINVDGGSGVIVDYWTTVGFPNRINISWPAQTGVTVTNLLTSTQSYIGIDTSGNIVQFSSIPTNAQRRETILLAQLGHADKTTVKSVNHYATFYDSPIETARDIINEFRLINDGNAIVANGANLNINKTGGYLFGNGLNEENDIKNVNKIFVSGQTATSFRYRTQTGGTTTAVSLIDGTNYDVNGVITTVPGGVNVSTNQRVYLFPNGNLVIQYGQTTYTSLTNAVQGVQSESFTVFQNLADSAILIGILSIRKGANSLSNSSDAKFIPVSKIGENIGGAAGISVTTLQQAYNNSTEPEILTNSTLGGITIKDGTGIADSNQLEIQNSASTTTLFITSNGNLSGNTISANTYLGLPLDIYVTSGTYSAGTATFTNNTGGTFSVTGFSTSTGVSFTGGTVSGATNFTSTISSGGTDLNLIFVQPNTVETITNKRITKRVVSVASSATPTLNTDVCDIARLTGLTTNITNASTNLSGVPTHGDLFSYEITDNGVARTIAWGASFAASGTLSLPTTTVINTLLKVLFQWNSATNTWVITAWV